MKLAIWITAGLVVGLSFNVLGQQRRGVTPLHTFRLWGTNQNELDKTVMFWGFTNGYFAGPRSQRFLDLADCLAAKMTDDQAVAMIDKFYQANPETWGQPLGLGVVSALTVRGGPCEGKNPAGP